MTYQAISYYKKQSIVYKVFFKGFAKVEKFNFKFCSDNKYRY